MKIESLLFEGGLKPYTLCKIYTRIVIRIIHVYYTAKFLLFNASVTSESS